MQRICCNMRFRWFVGLAMEVSVWDVTVSTKNRDRLLQVDIARGFPAAAENVAFTARGAATRRTPRADPDARLYKKSPGSAARPCCIGYVVMENRNGLVVTAERTPATGTAARAAAVAVVAQLADGQHVTMGAPRPILVMRSACGHASVDDVFGWIKIAGGRRKTRHC
jgi:hypothetical protein